MSRITTSFEAFMLFSGLSVPSMERPCSAYSAGTPVLKAEQVTGTERTGGDGVVNSAFRKVIGSTFLETVRLSSVTAFM